MAASVIFSQKAQSLREQIQSKGWGTKMMGMFIVQKQEEIKSDPLKEDFTDL
jgi:hypothetical protein